MNRSGLQFVGPEPGRWLQQEMTNFGGRVGYLVPADFPAFARILHRIDPTERALRWSQVCAQTGAVAHALMQWHLVCRGWADHDDNDPLHGRGQDDPRVGSLDPLSMTALYEVLARAFDGGPSASPVFHAFWNGWGGLHHGSVRTWSLDTGEICDPPDSAFPFAPEVVDGPTLDLPGREYLVFSGSLDPSLCAERPDSTFWPQSPSLSWPEDHSWCVATEIDFDSTLVAGSAELIAAVLAHPELEAWPVMVGDSLEFDGDTVNGT